MRYSSSPALPDAGLVYRAVNMVPLTRTQPSSYARRWGDASYAVGASGLTSQLIDLFRSYTGSPAPRTIGVFSGEIYDWVSGAWTKRITTANLAGASITLDASATVFGTDYLGKYIFNDGVNQPFMWDGTNGGGLTLLTNAPARCYGAPIIYYGKVVFIVHPSSSVGTIRWSEENAANTGYIAGGYNNTWTLSESGSGQIYALAGLNNGLYFFRETSIGVIRGAVTSTFVSDGVRDGISGTVGCTSPGSVRIVGADVYFVDASGHPYIMRSDQLKDLYAGIEDFFEPLTQATDRTYSFVLANLTNTQIVSLPSLSALLVVYRNSAGTVQRSFLFSSLDGQALSEFKWADTGSQTKYVGQAYDDVTGRTALMVSGISGGSLVSLLSPPPNASALYTYTGSNPSYELDFLPVGVVAKGVNQFTELEIVFDIGKQSVAGTGTCSVFTGAATGVLGTGSLLSSLTVQTFPTTGRAEVRHAISFDLRERWLNLQLTDSSTAFAGWGVNRASVTGELDEADTAVT